MQEYLYIYSRTKNKKEYLVLSCYSLTHSVQLRSRYTGSIVPLLGIYVPPKVPTCTYVPEVPTLPYRRYLTYRSLGNTKLPIYIYTSLYLVASNNNNNNKPKRRFSSSCIPIERTTSNYQLCITTYYPTYYILTNYAVVSGIYTGHVFPLAGLLSLGA